eukprot:jgi/Phyca11/19070/fgenesh1_pg.PHYCAscaffold_43_\
MNGVGSDTERRLRAMETAFRRERQQRDLLEKKYARLKRRYNSNNGQQTSITQSETPGGADSSPNSRVSTNIAAYQEFEARRLQEAVEREYQQQPQTPTSALLAGLAGHERNLDPDNMTYEELLRLGEENGDVKKERWRQMAVQVLSSLPTHRWTRGAVEDTCIICQYDFVPNDRAMTLPCAHVFHEAPM